MKLTNKTKIYLQNRKKAKIYKRITPLVFWGLIALSIFLFAVAIKNSLGNMDEITSLLNNKKFTGDELRANYLYLIDKYGEWVIGSGSTGFTLTFINVKSAIFGGLAVATGIGAIVCFIGAFLLGKWILPALAEKYTQDNQDLANLTIFEIEKKQNGDK